MNKAVYNFDKEIERFNTNSIKFDSLQKTFGKDDLLPMWIADMDFQSPPAIMEAVKKRAEHGVFGYTFRDNSAIEAFIDWVDHRYNWKLSPEMVGSSPGIVTALALAVRIFTSPGDKVLIQTPVYPPFFSVVEGNKRELVTSHLVIEQEEYRVNWEDFEKQIASGVKMFILCNSHNPIGKVWSREELTRMGEICVKHNVLIFSDEIHADLTLFGNQHTVMASTSKEVSKRTITAMAPSKTFNIAGLLNSVIVSESPELIQKFNQEIELLHLGLGNLFGHITMEAAYRDSEEWLNEAAQYIGENVEFAYQFLKKHNSKISFIKPQSSFLLWLDFNKTGLSHQEIKNRLIEVAKVGLNDGTTFGSCGSGFFRMNIGTRRAIVEEALTRIVEAFK